MENLSVTHSPHFGKGETTRGIMADVLIALSPAAIAGVIWFGIYSLAVIAVCIATAILSEYLCCRIMKKENTTNDLSAAVTGLLLAMNLPPKIPLWIAMLGSAVAIVIVKQLFGGIGQNFANPAITARIVLLVSFPTLMTQWVQPFAWLGKADTVAGATPLAELAEGGEFTYSYYDLFFGMKNGCIGEVFAFLLLLGGIYLVIRRVITPIIPVSYLLTAALFGWMLGYDPMVTLLTGGLMLGAIFMATDYTTSPVSRLGQLIFGIGCGIITIVIRKFGNLPEGVSYSILLMNILTPLINRVTMPKPFGWEDTTNEK